jgi:ABC-type transport system involved in cytochrome bd biosynthesis fused ATPase/permease subunit
MDAMNDTGNLRQARAIVSEKLRAYFAEIKAGLDADSEDFFKRVMQQADQRQHAGLR